MKNWMTNLLILAVGFVILSLVLFLFLGGSDDVPVTTDVAGESTTAQEVPTSEPTTQEALTPSSLTPVADEALLDELEGEVADRKEQVEDGGIIAPTSPPLFSTPAAEPTEAPSLGTVESVLIGDGFDTGDLVSPGAACQFSADLRSSSPSHLEMRCPAGSVVTAPATGRVVGVWSEDQPDNASSAPVTESWNWADIANLGASVVIDHGPMASWRNVTSVLSGFDSVDASLSIAAPVASGDSLGTVGESGLRWQIWVDNQLLASRASSAGGPSLERDKIAATGLSANAYRIADDDCPLDLVNPGELPNAARSYRNGIHRGVDLVCGTSGHNAYAFVDGTVVMVNSRYEDPNPGDRNAVLANASAAGFTPHWTLNMLYGNFVVIEHGQIDGREIYSISAHLDSVAPEIEVGVAVTGGQLIGTIGNTGTGPAAAGVGPNDRSYHLHWELFVDGRWLAQGLSEIETVDVYKDLLCSGDRPLNGC